MRLLIAAMTLLPVLSSFAAAQIPAGMAGYNILGCWHFEDSSASVILDSSPFAHKAHVQGTSIVQGIQGTARTSNGAGDYILIPPASPSAFNFQNSASVTIAPWIKTSQSGTGMILRRGPAPVPGFLIVIEEGRIRATIGNREDGVPPVTPVAASPSQASHLRALWSGDRQERRYRCGTGWAPTNRPRR
jgi:hypothetical protein